jgi:hypothetical protein
MRSSFVVVSIVSTLVSSSALAFAQEPVAPLTDATTPKVEEAPKPSSRPKPGYSLPFAMRPALAPNVVRLDASYVAQDTALSYASVLSAGGRVAKDFGIYGRLGLVRDAKDGAESTTGLSNPLLMAVWAPEIAPKTRIALTAALAMPLGAGGGDDPSSARAAMAAGIYARQAMDNALFATNYITPIGGAAIAWVDKGWTLQAEATVLQLLRARGAAQDTDAARTNFTSGVNVGYLIAGLVNVNLEAHYQRWLTTPAAVSKDPARRDQLTVGGGFRFNVPIGEGALARPGIGYFMGIDDPMGAAKYRIVSLDVPVLF